MNTDKASTNFLVTREGDGDVGLRMGGTQKFLGGVVHSLLLRNGQVGCRFINHCTLIDRITKRREWSGWPDLNQQPMDLFKDRPESRLLQSIALPDCSKHA
jgi:hypothetical protein